MQTRLLILASQCKKFQDAVNPNFNDLSEEEQAKYLEIRGVVEGSIELQLCLERALKPYVCYKAALEKGGFMGEYYCQIQQIHDMASQLYDEKLKKLLAVPETWSEVKSQFQQILYTVKDIIDNLGQIIIKPKLLNLASKSSEEKNYSPPSKEPQLLSQLFQQKYKQAQEFVTKHAVAIKELHTSVGQILNSLRELDRIFIPQLLRQFLNNLINEMEACKSQLKLIANEKELIEKQCWVQTINKQLTPLLSLIKSIEKLNLMADFGKNFVDFKFQGISDVNRTFIFFYEQLSYNTNLKKNLKACIEAHYDSYITAYAEAFPQVVIRPGAKI